MWLENELLHFLLIE